jgi:thiol:disulfide interchange protein DsbD
LITTLFRLVCLLAFMNSSLSLVGVAAANSPPALLASLSQPPVELPTLPASASIQSGIENDEAQLRARLLVSSGPNRRVGVLLELQPGWHVYWRNPGGTGIAPSLGLEADGALIDELAWPAPQTFEEADGLFTTWGYEGSVLLTAAIEPLDGGSLEAGRSPDVMMTGSVRANARVLICRTQCVPAEFTLSSPLSPALAASDQERVDRLFSASLARVPVPSAVAGLEAEARWLTVAAEEEPRQIQLTLETCGGAREGCPALADGSYTTLFVPIEGDTFEFSQTTLISQDAQSGHFVLGLEATRLEAGEDRLRGLIALRDEGGRLRHVEVDVPIGSLRTQAAPLVSTSPTLWLEMFLLAMLGGLILNGMPCVLPVLAIKVVAIADMAKKNPREVRLHGLAYTAGVLGSMSLLALVVLGLRGAGHSVGWGFQFQEPLFVAMISALLVTFALNLFGVFEIELGQGRLATIGQEAIGLQRSAFEGLLAVVLATPCTAPFLGTAVGFAFASSGAGVAAIFLAIGFGLASPFLLVSFFPKLARFIPRAGPWMNTLRAGLGFSLLATVVWLLWVLGQSGGVSAVVSMASLLLFLAFLLWGFGQLQPTRSVWLGRIGAASIVALAFAGFNLIEFDRSEVSIEDTSYANASAEEVDARWQPYSESAVAEALDAGRPAFVVFTADWCITCQVNERTVLDREAIRRAFADQNYSLFKADWTRRDERIRARLAEFGRAGVPLYLVYEPGRPDEPQILSELLSQREVLTALEPSSVASRI